MMLDRVHNNSCTGMLTRKHDRPGPIALFVNNVKILSYKATESAALAAASKLGRTLAL